MKVVVTARGQHYAGQVDTRFGPAGASSPQTPFPPPSTLWTTCRLSMRSRAERTVQEALEGSGGPSSTKQTRLT
jgi:hypothetical protein